MKVKGLFARYVALLGVLACLLCGIFKPASATTLAGFVTSIPEPGLLEVGKVRVKMVGGTTCFVQSDSNFDLKLPQIFEGRVRWRSKRALWKHGTPIACTDLSPLAGSRVDVWGRFTNANTFEAAAVVIHRPTRAEILQGAALLESTPWISESGTGIVGEAWIDGYLMRITPRSTMTAAPAGTDLAYRLHGFWHNLEIKAQTLPKSSAPPFTLNLLRQGAWATYDATATPDGNVIANRVRVWSDKSSQQEKQFIQQFEPAITLPNYVGHIDGKLEFRGAPPISIVADASVQEWVSMLGENLVPPCWRAAECSGGAVRHLRFFVVREFPAQLGDYFVVEGHGLPVHQLLRWNRKSSAFYAKPSQNSLVGQVVVCLTARYSYLIAR